MDAATYLKAVQRTDVLFDWLLELVPPGQGGTSLTAIPSWLEESFELLKVPVDLPPIDKIAWCLREIDWARARHEDLLRRLPADQRAKLSGATFAIGSSHASEFNGRAIRVPMGGGAIVVLPIGAMMLMNNVSALVSLHLHAKVRSRLLRDAERIQAVNRGGLDHVLAWLNRGALKRAQDRFPASHVAKELALAFNRYAKLGVTDTSGVLKTYLPVPQIVDPKRLGHPLELVNILSWHATGFLLLHEYAHVLLDHFGHRADPFGDEFAADELAFSIIQKIYAGNSGVALVGAALFLWSAVWLEENQADDHSWLDRTHPPARKRLARLAAIAPATDAWLLDALAVQFQWMWVAGTSIRQDPSNSLEYTIIRAVREGSPGIFYDQFPRWVMWGAPQPLCVALATARATREKSLSGHLDIDKQSELKLVMWAYEAARSSPTLSKLLENAYGKARNEPQADSQ